MTNEQIVSEIRNGYSVTDYMQLLYESNLPLIKKFIKPYAAYGGIIARILFWIVGSGTAL